MPKKPKEKRTHRDNVERARPKGMSAEAIRHAHCEQQRLRNAVTRKRKREEAEARQEERNKRSDKEQLALLAKRPGQSKRETKRLLARIAG